MATIIELFHTQYIKIFLFDFVFDRITETTGITAEGQIIREKRPMVAHFNGDGESFF